VLIDWHQCVLCQERTTEKLLDPEKNHCPDKVEGLKSLATNLAELHEVGALSSLPFNVSLSALQDGCDDIFESFKKNHAKYHKSCKLKCSTSKLVKLSKRAHDAAEDKQSPIKTRRHSEAFSKETFLFCDGPATWKNSLHRVSYSEASKRLGCYAKNSVIENYFANLLVLSTACRYHSACNTAFNNKIR